MKSSSKVKGSTNVDLRKVLLSQCEDRSLCDITLTVGVEQLHAHRCVLAAMSPFFNVMFTGHFKEKDEKVVDLSATFQTMKPLQDIVRFMYGEELHVTKLNIRGCLKGSSYFQIPELTLLCLEYLLANLRVDNCLQMWTLAEIYGFKELSEECSVIAPIVFPEVLKHLKKTLTVPVYCMVTFLQAGLCKRCNPQEIKQFLDLYTNTNKVEDHMVQELCIAAGLEEIVLSAKNNNLYDTSCNSLVNSSKSNVCLPQAHSENSTSEVLKECIEKEHEQERSQSTTLLCWNYQKKRKVGFVLYSVTEDKWHTYNLDQDKASNFGSPDSFVGFINMGNRGKIAALYRSSPSYVIVDMSTGTRKTLPDVPAPPDAFIMGNMVTDLIFDRETDTLESFYLNEELYAVGRHFVGVSCDSDILRCIQTYIVRLDKDSLTWKFVCFVGLLKEVISAPICRIIQLSDREAFIITMQDEEISVYRFCVDEHGEASQSMLQCQNKISSKDVDKFDSSKRQGFMYYFFSVNNMKISEVAQQVYIEVKWGCTLYNPAKNEFGMPDKPAVLTVKRQKLSLRKCGSLIYTPSTGIHLYVGSNFANVHFIVQENTKGSQSVIAKCPIFGTCYDFLRESKPKVLHMDKNFMLHLNHVSPADYVKPLLPSVDTERGLRRHLTRAQPLQELTLQERGHKLDEEGRCDSCMCVEVGSY